MGTDWPWILYLRKSRQDDPRETVEEVLAKHETMLQEYAERELGGRIPPENIYREVVSGESIEDRIEIKQVLTRLENPDIRGVVVMEPSRLSRGDLMDCAKIIDSFRFTHSLVVTPMMTYDLEKKMERKFFQDELLRGNDYLEYTKEILYRGRVAAIKRGCYIGNYAPYGYKKVKIGKDFTLEIIEEEAEIVRLVFDLYTRQGLTFYQIACRLNEMGVKPSRGVKWPKDSIRYMLKNRHYDGKVVFNQFKETQILENGKIIIKKIAQPEEEIIIAEGKHQAIVDHETWIAAQEKRASHPRLKKNFDITNPFAGIIRCAKCGYTLRLHPYQHAENRYTCKKRPPCYKSVRASVLINAVLEVMENSELPALERKAKNGDGDAAKIQQRRLKKLEKQMEEYREQEEKQFDLLETGKYSQDLFDRRNAALRAKMEDCQAQIYQTKTAMPQGVDYAERVVALKDAIAIMRNPAASPAEQNRIVKGIIEKIEYTGPVSDPKNRKRQTKNGFDPFDISITLKL